MLLLRTEQPDSSWIETFFFPSLYLCGLLLVTLQSNNLPVWAINTATTASASISSGVSWVPVHEERSTERASTNTSRQTHTNIYSSSCSQSPTHTCTYIDTKTLMGWIQTITEHETQIVTYSHNVTVIFIIIMYLLLLQIMSISHPLLKTMSQKIHV